MQMMRRIVSGDKGIARIVLRAYQIIYRLLLLCEFRLTGKQ